MKNAFLVIIGIIIGTGFVFLSGVWVPANIDNTQREKLRKKFSVPAPATVDPWKGVKLVRWCEKGSFGVYALTDGTLKAADPKWGAAGVVVADPEKVC